MTISTRRLTFGLVLLTTLILTATASAAAQGASGFQGEWEWAVYAKSRDELPRAYREARLKDVPNATIYLTIKQRGNRITGEYSGSRRFLAKLEDGEFEGIVKGKVAKLELTSGFEGTVTVLLTREGKKLHWKTIKSEGEYYFPDDVYLHRVVRRKPR